MARLLTATIESFRRSKNGNIAITTALCAIPVFAMLGFSLDYGIALSDKTKLDNAADVATMAAINAAQSVLAAQGSSASAAATAAATSAAQGAFAANAGRLAFITGATTPVPTITINYPKITANIQYSYATTTNFSKIIGVSNISVKGGSTASLTMPTYINYYILVDVSQSMGIGSTQTDMANLYNRSASLNMTNGGCVFGCHVASPGDSYSMEYVAHNMSPYITLRIDAAVSAIQNVITQAQTQSGSSGNVQIGLYTMSGYPMSGSRLTTLATPTSNYSQLTSLAATIDLGPNNGTYGYGDSDFVNSMNSFNSMMPAQGDGSSASSPKNYVVIITDGVQDTYSSSCNMTHCTTVFPDSECTTLQQKANVGIIYTTYIPIYANNNSASGLDYRYNAMVYPFASNIAPNLQSCASSSSLYFEASDGPAINTSLSQLFTASTQIARVTH